MLKIRWMCVMPAEDKLINPVTQRQRCFLSLHFLFKDLTHYQE